MQLRKTRRSVLALIAAAGSLGPVWTRPTPERPRHLLADEETVAAARIRLKTSIEGRRWLETARRQADELTNTSPIIWGSDSKRGINLNSSREFLRRVELLTSLAAIDDDPARLTPLREQTIAVCNLPDWNPSHFLDVAETTMGLAIAYASSGDLFEKQERDYILTALRDKALMPGLDGHRRDVFWARGKNNWGVICNGALAIASRLVARENVDFSGLAKNIFDLALLGLRGAMAGYAPDGGWIEGPSYWGYATRFAAMTLAALTTLDGYDYELADTPGFSRTAHFILHMRGPTGRFFNFADGPEHLDSPSSLLWLARRFSDPQAAWLAAEWDRMPGSGLLWSGTPTTRSPTQLGTPLVARFRGPEVVSMRSAWDDRNAMWIAIKGGDNNAPHGHLDLGGFVIECQGERFAVDFGADDYALPGYFDRRRRFSYFRTGADGHNLLTTASGTQSEDASAPIASETRNCKLSSTPAQGGPCATIELSRATTGLASHRRTARMPSAETITLTDDFRAHGLPVAVLWRQHVLGTVSINASGKRAKLKRKGATLYVHLLSPENGRFEVTIPEQRLGQNIPKVVRRLQIRIEPRLNGQIVVLFSPLEQPPEAIVRAAIR